MEDLEIEYDILAREAINARLPDSAKDQIIGSLIKTVSHQSLANHLTDPYVARELPGGIY